MCSTSLEEQMFVKDINTQFVDERVSLVEDLLEKGDVGGALSLAFNVGDSGAWDAWLSIAEAFSPSQWNTETTLKLHNYFQRKYIGALQKAAEEGDLNALWRLKGVYLYGHRSIVDVDEQKGYKILLKLAEDGYPEAQATLGDYLLHGQFSPTIPKNVDEAKNWLNKSAISGNERANILLRQIVANH